MFGAVKLQRVHLRNFMSFGNGWTEVDLSNYGATLIQGENIDANSNNGAGKCVQTDTLINIRNKITGKILTVSIGEFYEMLQKS